MSKMIVSAWLILLASTALSASLAACRQISEGGSSPPPLPAVSPTFPLAASPIPSLTSTPEPTKTPESTATATATPEQLGGEGVGVAFWYQDGVSSTHVLPPEIASRLIPTTPDRWKEIMNLTDSTGQPLPWGKPAFFDYWEGGPGDGINPVIPFLVRDIVQYGTHKGENNAPMYFAILETPAQGGSNFYIKELIPQGRRVNLKYSYVEYPSTGLPAEWLGQKVPIQTFIPLAVDRLSDTQLLELLQANVGKVVLLEFPDETGPVGSYPPYEEMVKRFWYAELIPKGFEASPGISNICVPASP